MRDRVFREVRGIKPCLASSLPTLNSKESIRHGPGHPALSLPYRAPFTHRCSPKRAAKKPLSARNASGLTWQVPEKGEVPRSTPQNDATLAPVRRATQRSRHDTALIAWVSATAGQQEKSPDGPGGGNQVGRRSRQHSTNLKLHPPRLRCPRAAEIARTLPISSTAESSIDPIPAESSTDPDWSNLKSAVSWCRVASLKRGGEPCQGTRLKDALTSHRCRRSKTSGEGPGRNSLGREDVGPIPWHQGARA